MIVSDDIFVMLLTGAKFQAFTPKTICDATKNTDVASVFVLREPRTSG